jgi:hypothetical protein
VARSGLIEGPGIGVLKRLRNRALQTVINLPGIHLNVISAALLDQSINGFEKDTLMTEDMVRIGNTALAELDTVADREGG